jgi:hypothetical protein
VSRGSGFKGSEVQRFRVLGSGVFRGSEFSAASGPKNGWSNRKRNFEKTNNEYRILLRRTSVEVRYTIDLY